MNYECGKAQTQAAPGLTAMYNKPTVGVSLTELLKASEDNGLKAHELLLRATNMADRLLGSCPQDIGNTQSEPAPSSLTAEMRVYNSSIWRSLRSLADQLDRIAQAIG